MVLTPIGYRPRLVDERISHMLGLFGAVSIEGPKWCGKTWTAENHANSEIKLTDSAGPMSNRDYVSADVRRAFQGESPHLIDEWQDVPQIWDSVRNEVDKGQKKGRFLLTGSSVPKREGFSHSGAGRIGTVTMHTMSLYEMGDSDCRVSLKELFNKGIEMTECGDVTLEHLIHLTARGGWPGLIGQNIDDTESVPKSYLDLAIEDAAKLDGKDRNKSKMRMLFRSLSRNESTLAGNSALMRDMKDSDDENIAIETFYDYINCLDRIHLIDDIPNFRPNVRSEVRVGKASKRHLTDVSLAIAALGLNRDMLTNDLKTFGFMFESLCEHDLGIYSDYLGWKMFHYRDNRGREVDAVIETDDGRWGAFEIKLGTGQIEDAAKNLIRIREIYEDEGVPPSLLCIVCGMSPYAYQRSDGVFVVPITSMGP